MMWSHNTNKVGDWVFGPSPPTYIVGTQITPRTWRHVSKWWTHRILIEVTNLITSDVGRGNSIQRPLTTVCRYPRRGAAKPRQKQVAPFKMQGIQDPTERGISAIQESAPRPKGIKPRKAPSSNLESVCESHWVINRIRVISASVPYYSYKVLGTRTCFADYSRMRS